MILTVEDPLMKMLFKKSRTLSATDRDIFMNWEEAKLSLFEDKPIIFHSTWTDENIYFLAGEAETESNWIEVYKEAAKTEEEYAEMMSLNSGQFGE